MTAKKEIDNLIIVMIEKSQEAFLLAIEIYNKPTIKYKVEGFTFFICNAWELLLKAYMLKNEMPIHYHKKNNINRTISLTDAIKRIMTNSKDPIRINLEAIVGLRNMANHLIVPEYATLFNDIFTACVMNYSNKLHQYFEISINDKLPSNYMTMFLPSRQDSVQLIHKYNKEINAKFDATKKYVDHILFETSKNDIVPQTMAITYQIAVKQVKRVEDADFKITKTSHKEADLKVVHKAVDSALTHPLSNKQLLAHVNQELTKQNIRITPVSAGAKTIFTTYAFNLYNKYYKVKDIPEFAYKHVLGDNSSYTYSYELTQRIVDDICNDPDIFKKMKETMKIKKN